MKSHQHSFSLAINPQLPSFLKSCVSVSGQRFNERFCQHLFRCIPFQWIILLEHVICSTWYFIMHIVFFIWESWMYLCLSSNRDILCSFIPKSIASLCSYTTFSNTSTVNMQCMRRQQQAGFSLSSCLWTYDLPGLHPCNLSRLLFTAIRDLIVKCPLAICLHPWL